MSSGHIIWAIIVLVFLGVILFKARGKYQAEKARKHEAISNYLLYVLGAIIVVTALANFTDFVGFKADWTSHSATFAAMQKSTVFDTLRHSAEQPKVQSDSLPISDLANIASQLDGLAQHFGSAHASTDSLLESNKNQAAVLCSKLSRLALEKLFGHPPTPQTPKTK